MTNLKIGDVVVLKSSGPHMTIHRISNFEYHASYLGLLCVWFDGGKKIEDVFHPDAVELYSVKSVASS
jgi:uncharacterized protein YodC (DUF2158 family)